MKKIILLSTTFLLFALQINAQTDCSSAQVISLTADTIVSVSPSINNVTGTAPTQICNVGYTASNITAGLWFSYTNNSGIDLVVRIKKPAPFNPNTEYSASFNVYSGSCGSLTCLGGDMVADKPFGFFLDVVGFSFVAQAGSTYYIVFDDYYAHSGLGTTNFDGFIISTASFGCTTSVPYFEGANDDARFFGCHTTIDNNADGETWTRVDVDINNDGGLETFFRDAPVEVGSVKDDYLFSPSMHLTAGQTYKVSTKFNAFSNGFNAPYENLEIIMSQGNTVADATSGTQVFSQSGIIQNGTAAQLETNAYTGSGFFTPTTTGDYNIVFHTSSSGPDGFVFIFDYSIDVSLGIEDNALSQISLYPNPVKNILQLKIPAAVSVESASFYDLLGRHTQIDIGTDSSIDMSQMPAGVYILKLKTKKGTITKKVIKK